MLSTEDDGDLLEVNMFQRVAPEMKRELRLPTINNPRHTHIPQIARSSSRVWIDMMQVKLICWVFQRETLDACPHKGHQGMANLFLLECDDNGGHTHVCSCDLFCSRHDNCNIFAVECHQE
jgi:hypothetical protein